MRLVSMLMLFVLALSGNVRADLFSHTEIAGTQGPLGDTSYQIRLHYNPFDSSIGSLMATSMTVENDVQFDGVSLNLFGTYGVVRSFGINAGYTINLGDMVDSGSFFSLYTNIGYLTNVTFGPFLESHTQTSIMGAGFDPTDFIYTASTHILDPGFLFESMSYVITSHVTVTYDYIPTAGGTGDDEGAVPEPSSFVMLGFGMICVVGLLKYKK